jgi:hypothetical protein
MKKAKEQQSEKPSTVKQLATAMAALGKYTGDNSDAEHAAEAERLGGIDAYRLRLVNALLGIVEAEAILADSAGVLAHDVLNTHWQALMAAGVEDDPDKLLRFLRWRTLRVEGPLRKIAQNPEVGPLPLAAAHAVHGLQLLLEVCASGQNLVNASPDNITADLKAARTALADAAANIDIMLKLIAQVEGIFSR